MEQKIWTTGRRLSGSLDESLSYYLSLSDIHYWNLKILKSLGRSYLLY